MSPLFLTSSLRNSGPDESLVEVISFVRVLGFQVCIIPQQGKTWFSLGLVSLKIPAGLNSVLQFTIEWGPVQVTSKND